MALSDPQTLKTGSTPSTTGGSSLSMAKVIDDGLKSVYMSADQTQTLTVSHLFASGSSGKYPRGRRQIRIDKTASVTDPLTGLTTSQTVSVYLNVDEPVTANNVSGVGLFSDTAVKDLIAELISFALTSGLQDAWLQGQH